MHQICVEGFTIHIGAGEGGAGVPDQTNVETEVAGHPGRRGNTVVGGQSEQDQTMVAFGM